MHTADWQDTGIGVASIVASKHHVETVTAEWLGLGNLSSGGTDHRDIQNSYGPWHLKPPPLWATHWMLPEKGTQPSSSHEGSSALTENEMSSDKKHGRVSTCPFFWAMKMCLPARRDGTVQPLQSESSTRICIVCGCINIWEKLWSLICQNCAQLLFGDNLLWIRLFPTQGNHSHHTYFTNRVTSAVTSPCLAEGHVGELDDLAGKVLDVLHVHLHDVLRSSDAKGLRWACVKR